MAKLMPPESPTSTLATLGCLARQARITGSLLEARSIIYTRFIFDVTSTFELGPFGTESLASFE